MAGAFDHHLDIMSPGDFGKLAERLQLGELGFVVSVGNRAGTEAVAEREGDVVRLHDLADFLEMRVEEILLVMRQAPGGHNGAAARDDACDAPGGQGHIAQKHTRVDGEIVHALLRLLD
ncbi:hypothetical protein D3C71_1704520 [compost metagenome]